ncbi:MAG: DUF190 domain-containing protein [Rhodospirillales bacterium]|nr:DUF190 domain-containing protein [Rhodospirillales bacterium]
MAQEITITAVRIYVPPISHSQRKQQLQTLLHLLRDQAHVHGLTVIEGKRGVELGGPIQPATVGDVLRRDPDPPLVIEFFDEAASADLARRMLREALPECRIIWWRATSDEAPSVTVPATAKAGQHRSES